MVGRIVQLMYAVGKQVTHISALVGAFYLGAVYHQEFSRLEKNLLYKDLEVEEGCFRDAEGLEVMVRVNNNGNVVPVLYHKLSETYVPIKEEWFDTKLDTKRGDCDGVEK